MNNEYAHGCLSRFTRSRVICLGLFFLAITSLHAAPVGAPVPPVHPQEMSTEERIAYLEKQNAKLNTEVADLKKQLAQEKADEDKSFFADRFRITALEANNKTGVTTAQVSAKIDAQIAKLDDQVEKIEELTQKLGAVNSAVADLDQRFKAHSHSYSYLDTTYHNVDITGSGHPEASLITGNHQVNSKTSAPQ